MAISNQSDLVDAVSEPQHYLPETARELRGQSVHRLQVGLFGLCAMLLLVGLANIIMDRAQQVEVENPIEKVIAVDEPVKKTAVEPLADIGVVPSSAPPPEVVEEPESEPQLID